MAAADEANGITLQEAQSLIEAALTWAAERGYRMAVAVVDVGGHPVAMVGWMALPSWRARS